MKIVHVVEPLAGGMVTFIKSLVDNLPDDFHIIVHGERKQVTPFAEVKKQFTARNVKFLRWKSAQRSLHPLKDIRAFIELFTILKRLKNSNSVDVVHLHCSKGGFIGRIVCRLLGIQQLVVYTPNGAPFMVGSNKTSNYLYKKLEKIAAAFGGEVVCCSPSEQKAYELAGINAITINNGIQYDKLVPVYVKRKKKQCIHHCYQWPDSGSKKIRFYLTKLPAILKSSPSLSSCGWAMALTDNYLRLKNIEINRVVG